MYAIVTRRKINEARSAETRERAQRDFFPKLQRTPGFVSFTLIQDTDGVNNAVVVFESEEAAAAFREEGDAWGRTLDELGHTVESFAQGQVTQHLTAST